MSRTPMPFENTRKKVLFEYLDKYMETSTRQLAKIIYRDHSELFVSYDDARDKVRYWRGAQGNINRNMISTKKYFKHEI